jgi:hypothetical protein
MLKALGFGLLLLAASTGGAAADNMCGDDPIAPLIPSVADMKSKPPQEAASSRHSAFLEVRRWQGELKSYRQCLSATVSTDKRKLGEGQRSDKPDKTKLEKLQAEIEDTSRAFDSSVDEEESIVNDFHAAQVAYCTRSDVDRTPCPKM